MFPHPLRHSVARYAFCVLLALLMPGAAAGAHADGQRGVVFLTFDDGPIDITLAVLDVLKAEQIKATFFANAIHLGGRGGERESHAAEALRRIIAEGHVLGNHSYDHMVHNRPPGVYAIGAAQAYRDIDTDLSYFLAMNVAPIESALGELAARPNNQIPRLARLPSPMCGRFRSSTAFASGALPGAAPFGIPTRVRVPASR